MANSGLAGRTGTVLDDIVAERFGGSVNGNCEPVAALVDALEAAFTKMKTAD